MTVSLPPLTDAAIAAAAGAALRRIRLERVVQDLEQLGMSDLAFVVVRRAENPADPAPARARFLAE